MLGPLTIKHGHVVLSNSTATMALFDDGDEVNYNVTFSVQNIDAEAIVYIGGSGVTSSSYGVRLAPNDKIDFPEMPRNPALYAISDTDGSSIAVLRMSK